jgi:hypothetical protein
LYLRSFYRFILICLALLFLSMSSVNAATLNVGGGNLLGASGINVGGTLYNVEFLNDTCITIFDGCDSTLDFAFNTSATALEAATALLVQVFLNTGAGDFAARPDLTFGCSDPDRCHSWVPYAFNPGGDPLVWQATNNGGAGAGQLVSGPITAAANTANSTLLVFARFTIAPISPVPIPAAIWLFGTALIGLVGFGKRKARIAA